MIIHTHFVKSLKTINYYLIDWNKNSILIIRECSHTFLYDLVCCCNVPFSSLLDNRRHWPGSIGGNWWFQCQWQQPGQSKVRFSIYITQTQSPSGGELLCWSEIVRYTIQSVGLCLFHLWWDQRWDKHCLLFINLVPLFPRLFQDTEYNTVKNLE